MAGMLGRGRFALPAAGILIAGLSDCREPTEITLEIKTDAACADVTETSINVGDLSQIESAPASTTTERCQEGSGRIGSIVIVPSGDKSAEVTIRIITGLNKSAQRCIDDGFTGGCIVARRTLNYRPHTPLVLPVEMSIDCVDIPCGATETCFKGKCVPSKIIDPGKCTDPGGCGDLPDAGEPDVVDSSVDQSSGGSGGTSGAGGSAGSGASGGAAGQAGASGNGTGGTDAGPDAPACVAPLADCDANASNACETNLDTDAAHCGACGHSCLGGKCAAGKCQPVVLFKSVDPVRIAVDATEVFVADFNGGAVLKASKFGGSSTPLATGQGSPRYIAIDATDVYWANYTSDKLMKVPKSGGTPTPVATLKVPFGFVIVGSTIYATSFSASGGLFSVPTSGGTPLSIVPNESWVPSLDSDGTSLYWAATSNNATLRKAPLTGGTAISIGGTFANAQAIKVDSTYAYVLFQGNGQGTGEVRRIAFADGTALTLASAVDGPTDIAIDSTYAYFTESNGHRVRRARLDGSAPAELVHTSAGQPWGITVDATAIYWTDKIEGVLKLAK